MSGVSLNPIVRILDYDARSIFLYAGVSTSDPAKLPLALCLEIGVVVDPRAVEEDEFCDALRRLVDLVHPAYIMGVASARRTRARYLGWKEKSLLPCLNEILLLDLRRSVRHAQ